MIRYPTVDSAVAAWRSDYPIAAQTMGEKYRAGSEDLALQAAFSQVALVLQKSPDVQATHKQALHWLFSNYDDLNTALVTYLSRRQS